MELRIDDLGRCHHQRVSRGAPLLRRKPVRQQSAQMREVVNGAHGSLISNRRHRE